MLKDHAEDAADGAGMPAESGEPVDNTVSKDSGPEKSDTADSGAAHVAVHNAHERELEDVAAEGLAEKNQRKKPESKAVVRPKAKTEPKKLMTAAKAKTTKGAGAGPKATCKSNKQETVRKGHDHGRNGKATAQCCSLISARMLLCGCGAFHMSITTLHDMTFSEHVL